MRKVLVNQMDFATSLQVKQRKLESMVCNQRALQSVEQTKSLSLASTCSFVRRALAQKAFNNRAHPKVLSWNNSRLHRDPMLTTNRILCQRSFISKLTPYWSGSGQSSATSSTCGRNRKGQRTLDWEQMCKPRPEQKANRPTAEWNMALSSQRQSNKCSAIALRVEEEMWCEDRIPISTNNKNRRWLPIANLCWVQTQQLHQQNRRHTL